MNSKTQISALLLLLSACAPKLTEDPNDVEQVFDSAVSTLTMEDGSFETTVAALSDQEWVAFSFDTGKEVFASSELEKSREWDLRFLRFNIRINSGVSGPGEVELASFVGAKYEDIIKAPGGGYLEDREDLDEDGDHDLAFRESNESSDNGWFKYDPRFHTVTPADVVYIVHAMNGIFYKMEFVGYYDENGEGGFPRFRWTVIGSP